MGMVGALCGSSAYGDRVRIKSIGEDMTSSILKRKRRSPVQEKLEKLHWIILRDISTNHLSLYNFHD